MRKNKSAYINKIITLLLISGMIITSFPEFIFAKNQTDIDILLNNDMAEENEESDIKDMFEYVSKKNDKSEIENKSDSDENFEIVDKSESDKRLMSDDKNDTEDKTRFSGYRAPIFEREIGSIYDYGNSCDNSEFIQSDLPETYRTGSLPELRNQSPWGTCWAHASIALAEINMMKKGYELSPNYSELHLAYFSYNSVTDPLGLTEGDEFYIEKDAIKDFMDWGGNPFSALNIFANWIGPVDESMVPYNNDSVFEVRRNGLSDDIAYKKVAGLKNAYLVNTKEIDAVKQLIIDYGAASTSYYNDSFYYNVEHNSYYCDDDSYPNDHEVTIVGWDDNFPRENFKFKPEADGAWLIRNSWTTGYEESYNGYFWMSYYDKSLRISCAFDFEKELNYDNNYHYDGISEDAYISESENEIMSSNIFKASADADYEELKAVSAYIAGTNIDYRADVYMDLVDDSNPTSGTLVSTKTGHTVYEGYYTIDLDNTVLLEPGEKFSVVLTFKKPGGKVWVLGECSASDLPSYDSPHYVKASISEGQSFYKIPGEEWIDVSETQNYFGNIRIKAFTSNRSASNTKAPTSIRFVDNTLQAGLNLGITETYTAGISVLPEDANKHITWTSSNPSVATVSDRGLVTAIGEGKATISASAVYGGEKSTFDVTVTRKVLALAIEGSEEVLYNTPTKYNVVTTPAGIPTDGKVEWSTSDPSVFTVDTEGVVTAHSMSVATLKATADGVSAELQLTVTVRPPKITDIKQRLDGSVEITWDGVEESTVYDIYSGLKPDEMTCVGSEYPYGVDEYQYVDTKYMGQNVSGILYKISSTAINEGNYTEYTNFTKPSEVDCVYPTEYTLYYLGGTNEIMPKKLTYDEYSPIEPSDDKPGREFIGWNTESDGTGEPYYYGEKAINLAKYHNQDVYLYAQWRNKEYTISFDATGGYCDLVSEPFEYGSKLKELSNPTRQGYVFAGWYTGEDGSGDEITSETLMYYSDNITVYAKWTADTVSVLFDANGGSVSTASKDVIPGVKYGILPTPSRTGYTFIGWYTEPIGGVKIDENTVVNITTNTTLYAHWIGKEYTVSFNANGGSCSQADKTVHTGDLYGTLPNPSWQGYTFIGWYTDEILGTEITAESMVSVAENHKLYAHWTANTYTVDFDANGGSVSPLSKDVTFDSVYGELPTPERLGYKFDGWYTSLTFGVEITKDDVVMQAKEHTLYAHWSANKYSVSFDANGGDIQPTSMTVTFDSIYGVLPDSERVGYTFAGWYDNIAGLGDAYTFDKMPCQVHCIHIQYNE